MRRQARISAGGALRGRSASALQVWLWLLIYIFQNEFRISRSIEPGYLDFDNLPETNFTCAGKVIGGYYADLETSCQMFHVCTVGQQEEPMDIKFLCLNGTVFDQETRVCERVDEVDCTKSEKFYSLNLELYGSTLAPPTVESDQPKPQAETTESHQQAKPSKPESTSASKDESPVQNDKFHEIHAEIEDSTEDPIEIKKEDPPNNNHYLPANSGFTSPSHDEADEENEEEDEVDQENDYDDDYAHSTTTVSHASTTSTTSTTTTTTTKKPTPTTTTFTEASLHRQPSPVSFFNASPSPPFSSLSPPSHSPLTSSVSAVPTLDPSLLSPQEFIYRHRGPGSEAISFQRQSFRPADGVFITHAPPHQFDHFQYESSRTAPRPAPFAQKPQPFRPTTVDPRDQLLRPGQSSQSSERHEMTVKHKPQTYLPLPAQRPLPFDPFYYDRKRSDESVPENESTLAARSVAPPHSNKPKSPPRVIVTASASVSDSNGKRLNYTVGNVVSAVKPIVPINYDDYKESDLIFDPFFLDVPKLQKRRKTRSNQKRRVFSVPITATVTAVKLVHRKNTVTAAPVTSRATTTESSTSALHSTTTAAWNPNDYVDDNYEPHAYVQLMPPLAILHHEKNKYDKQESKSAKEAGKDRRNSDRNIKHSSILELVSRPSSSVVQTTSSQSKEGAPPAVLPPPAPPLQAPADAIPCSIDNCRTHA